MKTNTILKYSALLILVLIVFVIVGKKKGWVGKGEVINVSVEKAAYRDIVETVSANGKVEPETEVKISSDVSGEIVELTVKEGDKVKKGQLLARINPVIYASNLEKMEAALNTSKANLANAKAREAQSVSQYSKAESAYKRNKKLNEDGTISPSDFESAKSAYEVAKSEVEAARQSVVAAEYSVKSGDASLKEAKDNLQKTTILAPVDGTVSKLNVEKGERVVGTSQMAGTEMMRIANLNEMEVTVDVNENDIVKVHMADTALIEVDSYQDRKFRGIVTEIGNSANTNGVNTDQVTNFTVKIRILRESYQNLVKDSTLSPFRPGMSATVDIRTRRALHVVSVPIQSVTVRDTVQKVFEKKAEGEDLKKKKETKPLECVFVMENGKAYMRTVTTGIQDNTNIEIISGLKDGVSVISGPYSAISRKLKDKSEVKVVSKEELFSNPEKE